MFAAIKSHDKVAVQVSGGRDSLAVFFLLREAGLLGQVTVYWVNSGDAFPETLAIMSEVRALSPRFIEIKGNQPSVIAQYGMPTDIMPRSCTPMGLATGQAAVRMQDSYSCCARVIMQPMHERMIEDGITLIIRGQRAEDGHKAPILSGQWENGIQYLFPIQDWSREQVDDFLTGQNAPRNACYDFMDSTPDCMSCSGWWSDGRSRFLKACHPRTYDQYVQRLEIIRQATEPLIATFNHEFGEHHE